MLGGIAGFIIEVVSLVVLFTDKLRRVVTDTVATTIAVKDR